MDYCVIVGSIVGDLKPCLYRWIYHLNRSTLTLFRKYLVSAYTDHQHRKPQLLLCCQSLTLNHAVHVKLGLPFAVHVKLGLPFVCLQDKGGGGGRRTCLRWWDESGETALQTQDSKCKPCRYSRCKGLYVLLVVSRYRDPQLQVGENHSYLLNLRPIFVKFCSINSDLIG